VEDLLKDENKKTRLLFIVDGALINAAIVLTAGIFLSGYVVFLEGSDFLVGLLNNSITWASVVAVFSYLIYERMKSRKKFLLILLVISRVMVCSTIFVPLIFGKGPTTLAVITTMVILGNVLWGIYGVGFSVWMMGCFSKDCRNEFVYIRIFWIRVSFTLFTIVMGFVLDWSGKSYIGFLIVFAASLVLSLCDAFVLLYVREPENAITKDSKISPLILFEPFTEKSYRGFLIFIFLFYTSQTISSTFSNLYMIRYLKFDYKFISIINVIAYIFMIICTRIWSRLESKKGMMYVFRLTGLIAVTELLIYGFLKSDTYFLLFIAPVFSGIGYSGFNVSIFTYRYELMPDNNRTVYEGWFGAILGLSMLISPVIGNFVMNRLPVVENVFFQYSRFQFMYLISFVLTAVVVLVMLKEPKKAGGVPVKTENIEG
jgi:Major Facilitator Superfamily.